MSKTLEKAEILFGGIGLISGFLSFIMFGLFMLAMLSGSGEETYHALIMICIVFFLLMLPFTGIYFVLSTFDVDAPAPVNTYETPSYMREGWDSFSPKTDPDCHGTGRCYYCRGTGEAGWNGLTGNGTRCPICIGTGVCHTCQGKGVK